jgi:anti-sigma B factor antagonist
MLEKPTAIQPFVEPQVSKCVAILSCATETAQVKWLPTRPCDGENDSVIVDLIGELSIFTAHAMKDLVSALVERDGHFRVVLNLQGLRYIDCTGFGALVNSLKRAQALGASVVFACASPQFTFMLDLAGLSDIFTAFESERAASKSFAASKPRYARLGGGRR